MAQPQTPEKPTLKGVAVTIFGEMKRKNLEKLEDRPGCQEAKLFGCTCNIFDNRGGYEGRIKDGLFLIRTTCQFHKWKLQK